MNRQVKLTRGLQLPVNPYAGERWRAVPLVRGVEASSFGRLRMLDGDDGRPYKRPQLCDVVVGNKGYLWVFLDAGRFTRQKVTRRTVLVSRLVCAAWYGWPKDAPNLDVRHRDDVKANNCPVNLEWGTRKDNMADCVRRGRLKSGADYTVRQKVGAVLAYAAGTPLPLVAEAVGCFPYSVQRWKLKVARGELRMPAMLPKLKGQPCQKKS